MIADSRLSSSPQAVGRTAGQRQASRSRQNEAPEDTVAPHHLVAGPGTASAAASVERPRNIQEGSITARRNTNRPVDSTRQVPVNSRRAGSAHSQSANAGGVSRQKQDEASTKADSSKVDRRKGPGNLDFGTVPTLNLNSGLEDMKENLSGLVDEFKQQGGFWKEGSLQDNISNMVQLGVKGALGVVSPIGERL